MSKVIYFDTETTGLDPVKNDIIQLACIIEIDNQVVDEFEFKIKPFDFQNISQEALDVHGYTLEMLREFPGPDIIYNQLIAKLSKYIDRYDKNDKFIPAGFNVKFDMDFLKQFFIKNQDVYFGSYFSYRFVDPLYFIYFLNYCNTINLPNYKLITVCEHYGIGISAHDALSDIRATRQLIKLFVNKFIVKNDSSKLTQLGYMVFNGDVVLNEFLSSDINFKKAKELIESI